MNRWFSRLVQTLVIGTMFLSMAQALRQLF